MVALCIVCVACIFEVEKFAKEAPPFNLGSIQFEPSAIDVIVKKSIDRPHTCGRRHKVERERLIVYVFILVGNQTFQVWLGESFG